MQAAPLSIEGVDSEGVARWVILGVAVLFSLSAHGLMGAGLAAASLIPKSAGPEVIEVALHVQEPKPPPEPEVKPPEVEPPKDVPKKPIKYEQTTAEAVKTDQAPTEDTPVVRTVRRISLDSTVKGGTTSVAVETGGDGFVGQETGPKEAPIADYAATATQPKLKLKPALVIPADVVQREIQGTVSVELDIDAEGKVTNVTVVGSLDASADAACIANARQSRWRPAMQGDVAVPVTGVPYLCTFKMAE